MRDLAPPGTDDVLLTREELVLLTHLIGAPQLPGMIGNSLARALDEQPEWSLAYAGRSLRSRGLASLTARNELYVEPTLVRSVTACAGAQFALWLTIDAETSARAYQDGDTIVLHTRPEPPLHRLQVLPDHDALADHLLALAGCDAHEPVPAMTFDRSESSQDAAATTPDDPAEGPLSEITVSRLLPQADGTIARSDVTVLRGEHGAWLQSGDREPQRVTTADLRDLLLNLMTGANRH